MSCNDCIILTLNTMEACKSRIKPFALNSHQTSSNESGRNMVSKTASFLNHGFLVQKKVESMV